MVWSSTGRPVAASRQVVLDMPRARVDWAGKPLAGDRRTLIDAYRELPHHQLVVLGEAGAAGAGKCIVAMLLTLDLLEHPHPGEPVPVLLPIASWSQPLRTPPAPRPPVDYELLRPTFLAPPPLEELPVGQQETGLLLTLPEVVRV